MSDIYIDDPNNPPSELVQKLVTMLQEAVGEPEVSAHIDTVTRCLELTIRGEEKAYTVGFRLPLIIDTLRVSLSYPFCMNAVSP